MKEKILKYIITKKWGVWIIWNFRQWQVSRDLKRRKVDFGMGRYNKKKKSDK